MGVLTDFVIGDLADADRIASSDCPSREFEGIEAKGVDVVKLGTLHAILVGGESDPDFMGSEAMLAMRSEEGPWVFEVPPDLVLRLAGCDGAALADVGDRWANTEEFSPPNSAWTADEVLAILREIASICRRARERRKAVMLWTSL